MILCLAVTIGFHDTTLIGNAYGKFSHCVFLCIDLKYSHRLSIFSFSTKNLNNFRQDSQEYQFLNCFAWIQVQPIFDTIQMVTTNDMG